MSDSSQKLKSLQTFLKEALEALYAKKDALRLAQNDERHAADRVARLQSEIRDLERNDDILFTEHSFIRFFERILGYDLEKVKEEMLPTEYRDRLKSKPYAEFRVGDSHVLIMKYGKVLTVVPPNANPPKIKRINDDPLEPILIDESTDSSISDGNTGEISIADENGE